jgi:hypothetical protein
MTCFGREPIVQAAQVQPCWSARKPKSRLVLKLDRDFWQSAATP